MQEPTDISYYIGKESAESLNLLDVPVGGGQIVSIDLRNELSDDPSELIQFLTDQQSEKQYWIIAASGYAKLGKLKELLEFINAASKLDYFNENDKSPLKVSLFGS